MNTNNMLVPMGIGIAIGGGLLWVLVELWPLLLIGGGLLLAFKQMINQNT